MSKKTLNKINLEALGAERLAALLMEVSTGSAIIKRRLRLELSHNLGTADLAHEVRKRLASLRKSNSFVGWRKRKSLILDLDTQVAMITDKIAPEDPTTAFYLLWQFIEIAPSIYERVDDRRGDIGDVFRTAIGQFKGIAPRAVVDVDTLAAQIWTAVVDNGYGEWDGIITLMAPTLGATGLAKLKAHIDNYCAAPLEQDEEDHEAIRFLRELRGGSNYAAERKASFVKKCLQEIAAAAGDTNAYIAQYSDADLKRKEISSEIAMLLLADGDAQAAFDVLLGADQDDRSVGQEAWDDAMIVSLTALGRRDDAQAHRWASFMSTLNARHLRGYLKGLPDFEDVESEDRAKQHALKFPEASTALEFCLHWPDLLTAAELVTTRIDEFEGDDYLLLTSAADALRLRHPLAAVLLWRAMINDTLWQGRTTRYGHGADHLMDCASLDAEIVDYGRYPSHESYVQSLRNRHDRKTSFWAKLS